MTETMFDWPGDHRAAASFTFDVDAESCVLAHDPGAVSRMSLMGHQSYGPRVGVPRLLRLRASSCAYAGRAGNCLWSASRSFSLS